MFQEIDLLLHMTRLQPCRHTCTWVPSGIQDVSAVVVLRLVEQSLDSRLSEAPGSGVERLLLTPDNVLGVGVHVEVLLQLSPWEGVELLDTGDCGCLDFLAGAVLVDCGVGLACAEDDALNLVGFFDRLAMLRIWDDPLEVRIPCELLDR